jgi:hypothetical protein
MHPFAGRISGFTGMGQLHGKLSNFLAITRIIDYFGCLYGFDITGFHAVYRGAFAANTGVI